MRIKKSIASCLPLLLAFALVLGPAAEAASSPDSAAAATPPESLPVPTAADLRIEKRERLDTAGWTIKTVTQVGYWLESDSRTSYASLNYQWYRAETDLSADAEEWTQVSTQPGGYFSEVPIEAGYEDYFYAVKVQLRENGKLSDWSELIKLSDIEEIETSYEIELPDRIYFEDTGILNAGKPTLPIEGDTYGYMLEMTAYIYDMTTGEIVSNAGLGRADTITQSITSFTWTSDGLNKDISASGTYLAVVQFLLYASDPAIQGWSCVARSHTVLSESKEIVLPDESAKVPAPTEFFRVIEPSYMGGGLDKLCWLPVGDVSGYQVMRYRKGDGGEWTPLYDTPDNAYQEEDHYYFYGNLDTPMAYKIRPISGNIQEYRSGDWSESDYILIDELKITLTDNLFTVDTSSVTADGTPKTKTVTPVALENFPLTEGRDYEVTYTDNIEVGTATLTVTGKGDYTGTLTYQFEITAPPAPSEPEPTVPSEPEPSVPSATVDRVTNPDGSVTETRTEPDGSRTVTVTDTNGAASVSAYASDGTLTSTEVTVPAGVSSLTVPVEFSVSDTAELTVKAAGEEPVKVRVPMEAADPAVVAVIVREDGTREIIRDSVVDGGDMVFPVTGAASVSFADNSMTFADTKSLQPWADTAVKFVTSRQLMVGTDTDAFSPETTVSRGMAATVLYRLAYEPETSDTVFSDIASGAYYSDAVAWAAGQGIVNGLGNGVFGAENDLTREQFAVMLCRFAAARGLDVSDGKELDGFADASDVSSYALEAMRWAVGAGIVTGNGTGIAPQSTATRAEAAAMLARFCAWMLR